LDLTQAQRAEIINRLLNEGLYETYRELGEKATASRAEELIQTTIMAKSSGEHRQDQA
jgi:hypothetical protein